MPKSSKKTTKPAKKSPKSLIMNVRKRDGSLVEYSRERIAHAVQKAMEATGEGGEKEAEFISRKVESELKRIGRVFKDFVPSVEGIQDIVEKELILEEYATTAKSYILYREERARMRRHSSAVPERVQKLAKESKEYFRNSLSEFIYYRTYSRWIEEEGRRETWIETVDRYIDFMRENLGDKLTKEEYAEVREGILKQEAMPSMRLFQFAGKAARTTNVCAYNCSYIAPTKLRDLGEIMYLSMCGTGVGFSVESAVAQQFPLIKKQTGEQLDAYVIDDSKEGWANALIHGLETWFDGKDVEFDYSKLRPAGARLKTMGGKSSGPDPLRALLVFTKERILRKQGKRLSNLDLHDVICKIGEIVVSGGVRRSALISLSDLDDSEMRHAKDGQFYMNEPQRMLANNSAIYLQKPSAEDFMDEWLSLMKGRSGERGIFNRGNIIDQIPERRSKTLDLEEHKVGCNPCGEIILRSKQFCNLSEIVARKEDTEESLLRKIRLAAILGTYQSSLTNFPFLSKEWKENCEEEALLGVSLTGQWDCPAVQNPKTMKKLQEEAVRVNKTYAKKMGINPSTAVTSVKPSGTVSQLVDSSSGMHARHSEYYIRRVRISATDSLFKMLKDQGITYHPEVGQSKDSATTYVLEFPIAAPKAKHYKDDLTALEQLEYWKMVKVNYTEQNPSVTISVGDDEWISVAHWLYENWEIIGGLSFLPRDNHVYQLAPYEAIDKETYEKMMEKFKDIDYSRIVSYEKVDETELKRELACVAGVCEV